MKKDRENREDEKDREDTTLNGRNEKPTILNGKPLKKRPIGKTYLNGIEKK